MVHRKTNRMQATSTACWQSGWCKQAFRIQTHLSFKKAGLFLICMSELEVLFKKKLAKYFKLTKEALQKVKVGARKEFDWNKKAHDFLDMAQRYFDDAGYFKEQGDLITAFASLNYAHGWLDAGARLGLFDVKDNRLFTVDAE